ncbi:hypothetical protein D3C80_1216790 [compost metagenome]
MVLLQGRKGGLSGQPERVFQHELANGIGVLFDKLVKQAHTFVLRDTNLVQVEVESEAGFEYHDNTWDAVFVCSEEQGEVAAGLVDVVFHRLGIVPTFYAGQCEVADNPRYFVEVFHGQIVEREFGFLLHE